MSLTFLDVGPSIQTTDATPTPIGAFDLSASTTVVFEGKVVARGADGTSAVWFLEQLSKADQNIVGALLSASKSVLRDLGAALWDVNFAINSSGQLELRVTGGVGATVNWNVVGTLTTFDSSSPP
jgi:hypothetical protein